MDRIAVVQALILLAACSGTPSVNSGQCPAIDVIQTDGGNCLDACESDSSCEGDHICCFNGCGLECMDVRSRTGNEARGVCPRFEHDTIGVCLDECSPSDDLCEDGKICCRNGCGYVCTTPVVKPTPEKQGKCPVVDDVQEHFDNCSMECTGDSDCKSTKKCCSNGCGRVCVNPVTSKKGSCPSLDILGDKTGDCVTNCTFDEECPGEQRCCRIGCSDMCMEPIIKPYHKECPKTIEGNPCKEKCSSDEDCMGEEICCDTGCGHVCVDLARPKPGHCPQIFKDSSVGICTEDCSSDGDCAGELKCCSNGCGHACTRPDEQPKPGNCPEIPDDTMGICSEECSSDANCFREQKCCSNGCGHACKEPVWYGCPDVQSDSAGLCTDKCESDTECVGSQMCCSNGCGHDCTTPVLKHKPNPSGHCPAVGANTVGICVDQCHSDADCIAASQRCCSTGCGHVCMDTVIETTHNSGCRLGENYYSDGEAISTSEECNTCICSSGEIVCKITGNCKGKGTFSVSMKTPLLCGVAGIIVSLLLVAVLVKCYVLRVVSPRRPYKMIYEVQEFEPIPRHML